MTNILKDWLEKNGADFTAKGYHLCLNEGDSDTSCSIDLDSDYFMGTVSYWPPKTFEFQFNSCQSGNTLFLETVEINSLVDLNAFLMDVLKRLKTSG